MIEISYSNLLQSYVTYEVGLTWDFIPMYKQIRTNFLILLFKTTPTHLYANEHFPRDEFRGMAHPPCGKYKLYNQRTLLQTE